MALVGAIVEVLIDVAVEVEAAELVATEVAEAVETQIAIAEDAELTAEETEFTAVRAGLREGYSQIAETSGPGGGMTYADNFAEAVEETTGVKPDMDPGNFDNTYEDTEPSEDDNCADAGFNKAFVRSIPHQKRRQLSKEYKRRWLALRKYAKENGLAYPRYNNCFKDTSPDKSEVKEGTPQDDVVNCSDDPTGPECEFAKADNTEDMLESMDDNEEEEEEEQCTLDDFSSFGKRLKYDIRSPEFKEWMQKRKYAKRYGLALPGDPPDPACKKPDPDPEKKPSRFETARKWFWRAVIFLLLAATGILSWLLHLALAQILGPLLMLWCRINGGCGPGDKCGLCDKKSDGTCDPACQKYNCDVNKYCQSKTCDKIQAFIDTLRKYGVELTIAYLTLSVILVFVFKSFDLVLFLLVLGLALYLLSGILGNWIATMVCNETAYDCYQKTGSVHC